MSDRKPKTMTVPEVRAALYGLAVELQEPRIGDLADQLWRRPPGKPIAAATSRAMTPELRLAIRVYAVAHPNESEHRIGIRFGVNQGRVSEALFGFRGR